MSTLGLPGFTAELALSDSPRRYADRRAPGPGGGLRAAYDDSDSPGVNCYYAEPFCENHIWKVNCVRYGSGGVPIQYFTKAVGSCVGRGGGGGGGSGGGDAGVDAGGGLSSGPGARGGWSSGITIDGRGCDPSSGDPDCLAVVVSRR